MEAAPSVFVKILLPFCIGIWVLRWVSFAKLNSASVILLILIVIILLIINFLYRLFKVYNYKKRIAVLLNLLFFTLGGWCIIQAEDRADSEHFLNSSPEYLKIAVADEPQQRGSVLRFRAKVTGGFYRSGYGVVSARSPQLSSTGLTFQKRKLTGNLLLAIRSDSLAPVKLQYGEVYLLPARYTPVAPPYNPGEFDFKSWLANQQIFAQSFLPANELIPTGEQHTNLMIGFALALRQKQVTLYRKLIKDDEAFAVASTLILGYRSDLDAETLTAYSKTGTIHALSVSGMHVGIIYVVLNFCLSWMNRKWLLKWMKLFIILALIWFYTLLTGYSASVLRSAIMLSLFIVSKAFQKHTGGYHILACSAFFLLFYNPLLLWDVGFQLSYMAVFGLIYLQPIVYRLLYFKQKWLSQLWNMVALSIAAQVLTFPFSIYYFHLFPVYFIISNLFITLPVALLMYAGIAILLFRLHWMAPLFEWLITFMNKGLAKIAALPYSTIDQIWLTKTELLLLILVFIFAAAARKHRISLAYSLLLLAGLRFMLMQDKISKRKQKSIILFSIKKNYAAAFISGSKAILVTDLSSTDRAFKFHIQPALDQQRIKTIVCLPWKKDTVINAFRQQEHQLVFYNFQVLLLDTAFAGKRIEGKPAYDAIWLHESPKVKIAELRQEVSFKKMWIDASNKQYTIEKYQQDTLNYSGSALVLKNNKGYVFKLK